MTTNKECEEHRSEIYRELRVDKQDISEIKGGIKAMKWVLPIVITLAMTVFTVLVLDRIGSLEKKVEKVFEYLLRPESTAKIDK